MVDFDISSILEEYSVKYGIDKGILITGAVFALLAILALIVVVIIVFRRRRKRKKVAIEEAREAPMAAITVPEPAPEPKTEIKVTPKPPEPKPEVVKENVIYQSPDGNVQIIVRYKPAAVERVEPEYKLKEIEIVGEDISSCLNCINSKYRLSSITIADSEGLVVGSTSSTPEEDAAHAVSFSLGAGVGEKINRIELIGDENSYIFNVRYGDAKLIVITKSRERIPEKYLNMLKKDIKEVLGRTFSFSKETSH